MTRIIEEKQTFFCIYFSSRSVRHVPLHMYVPWASRNGIVFGARCGARSRSPERVFIVRAKCHPFLRVLCLQSLRLLHSAPLASIFSLASCWDAPYCHLFVWASLVICLPSVGGRAKSNRIGPGKQN